MTTTNTTTTGDNEVITVTFALSDSTLRNIIALANTVSDVGDQLEGQIWAFRAEAIKLATKWSEIFTAAYTPETAVDKLDTLGGVADFIHDASVYYRTLSGFYNATTDLRNRAINFGGLNWKASIWEALDYVLTNREGGSPASDALREDRFFETNRDVLMHDDSLERVTALGKKMAECSTELDMELMAVRSEAYRQLNALAKEYVRQRQAGEFGDEVLALINTLTRHILVLNKLWKSVQDVRLRSGRFGSIEKSGNLWEAFSKVFQNREPDAYADVQHAA